MLQFLLSLVELLKSFPKLGWWGLRYFFSSKHIVQPPSHSESSNIQQLPLTTLPALHKKWNFPLRIFSVNVTKSTGTFVQCCVFDVVSENLITFVVILLFLKIKDIAIQEKPTCFEGQAVCNAQLCGNISPH